MNKKIGCFISTVITFILSCIAIYFCYELNISTSIENTGQFTKFFATIVSIPIYIIMYGLTLSLITSTIVTSIKAIQSSSKFIMIVSIIFLLFTLALFTICILQVLHLVKFI